jgi:hypothetical protein
LSDPPGQWPRTPAPWGGPALQPGAPGWAPPLPPKKVRLTWLWVVIGALAFFAIVFFVALGAFVNAVDDPVDAMNDFLEAVDDGDYAAAYDHLCARERAATPEREFPVAIAPFADDLNEYNVYSFDPFGRERAVEYSITDFSDDDTTYSATMVREEGAWRVCDFFDE